MMMILMTMILMTILSEFVHLCRSSICCANSVICFPWITTSILLLLLPLHIDQDQLTNRCIFFSE